MGTNILNKEGRTFETDFSTLPPDLDRAGDTEIDFRGEDFATEGMSWEGALISVR